MRLRFSGFPRHGSLLYCCNGNYASHELLSQWLDTRPTTSTAVSCSRKREHAEIHGRHRLPLSRVHGHACLFDGAHLLLSFRHGAASGETAGQAGGLISHGAYVYGLFRASQDACRVILIVCSGVMRMY